MRKVQRLVISTVKKTSGIVKVIKNIKTKQVCFVFADLLKKVGFFLYSTNYILIKIMSLM